MLSLALTRMICPCECVLTKKEKLLSRFLDRGERRMNKELCVGKVLKSLRNARNIVNLDKARYPDRWLENKLGKPNVINLDTESDGP